MSEQSKGYKAKAQELVSKMTLEEKALLLSGNGAWTTHKIERLGIPSIFMTDGPHGLRKAVGPSTADSVPATCFPTASALASSWDTELIRQVGAALARESQAHDVQVLLGPGINMKRSPLGGRNFEYFSEDPVLAGRLAAAYIQGVQGEGVGTSLKHFAVNNQEFERMVNSSNLDERTLHEIYLPAFEIAITQAQPWSVMCAYNKINGVYASENPLLLEDILRKAWGFEGFVVSDWGAVHDRAKGVMAGLNLEMPGSGDVNRKKIIEAVNAGQLPVSRLDEVVASLVAVVLKASESRRTGVRFDMDQHHALARQVAGESVILLKNDDRILPLDAGGKKKIALVGAFAKEPRYQGAGSSQVNPARISNAYDELVEILGGSERIAYAEGYDFEGVTTAQLLDDARQQAKNADVAIVFAGLPDSHESEGFDRPNLDMPEGHNQLIDAVSQVQPNTVVVLMNGSAIAMPWVGRVKGILEGWLTGQAGGGAIADILTGKVNPSAKLQETFPVRTEDTPTAIEFPGLNQQAHYGEGVFIGYRYYDKKNITPLFPFGFGLSYTTFAYSEMTLSASSIKDTGSLTVQVKVKNMGKVAGKEIVQLYVREEVPAVSRPEKELKAFAKVALQPGEEKTVSFTLNPRDFAYYNAQLHRWTVNPGRFDILVGGSSRDLPLRKPVSVEAQVAVPTLTRNSMVKEFKDHPKGKAFYSRLTSIIMGGTTEDQSTVKRTLREERARKKAEMSTLVFVNDMPAYKLIAFSEGKFTEQMLNDIIAQVQ
ncbi:glycoside hydrolase family 3 C-terminal domain-containing protein [Stigmatella sp. ncwal1]|uniref:Glycoside hydrolase family 3 C-terminal domain-containing protein n=1 Tax=Stigmatella ashevillensis TaxID=2995309 RepID=A0ABT5D4X4_9BACT|nr:glycoside hydrolase family 3 C-terminal domain-containing protein [Stigmatella ashevillena]MDC0708717.1 glycoside hydrolase family 3 C-terminal domain-containing protein [Stigmatella ashevillena]